ncbi:MAG: ferredoxin family protein [Acidimicrobiia bacterium]|nr:ferredoxin family protein [Acidimicrobiia bacterium]
MTAAAVTPASRLRVVLYEGEGSRPIDPSDRFTILALLLKGGYPVTSVRGRAAAVPERRTHPLLVLGRFERSLPRAAESITGGTAVYFRDLDGVAADEVSGLVESVHAEAGTARPGGWKPWFPVIDFSRCTNCMQCLTFCLFDVYGVAEDKQIQVQNPTNCKTDCPACSRVCPEVAILFPKYKMGPINGDVVRAEDVHREKMKVDISALLGGDIYAALRTRSVEAKERFSRERDEKRALDERRRCLAKLQEQLDIPPEVLLALPTQDEIRAKTERLMARAGAADGGEG